MTQIKNSASETTYSSETSHQRGQYFENLAETFLLKKGAKLVARNFRARQSEVDRIMLHNRVLLFVEVRYRKRTHFGHPLESITQQKQRRLARAAAFFLHAHPQWQALPSRFDVIAITPHTSTTSWRVWPWESSGQGENIQWIQDAFQVHAW